MRMHAAVKMYFHQPRCRGEVAWGTVNLETNIDDDHGGAGRWM